MPTSTTNTTTRTEYAVQAMSRSTGGTGRYINLAPIFVRRVDAERLADERSAKNARVAYRVVSRQVTPWSADA